MGFESHYSESSLHSRERQVHVFYLPGYIVLSYLISLMGCATTLEILHRRTSRSGFYNWFLLCMSSMVMGGIGIWCMHFIGNRAIVIGDGAEENQILYSGGFTGISFLLPVIIIFFAFYSVSSGEKAGYARILTGGILTGSSVCGMHYVGQLGIKNYECIYDAVNIAFSAIIAIISSTVALGVFFRWRATWTDKWWRRGACASLLAAAISGMHWTATVGTRYHAHNQSIIPSAQRSRSQVVIICTVLASFSCLVLFIFAIQASGYRKRSTSHAQQLILACAYFDQLGRIMVTPHGDIPTQKIVKKYIGRTFDDDDLTRTHSSFLWVFQASRNWPILRNYIPVIRRRLKVNGNAIERYMNTRGVVFDQETEIKMDFDTLFKQLFCVAAQELSNRLQQSLEELGVVYDNILATHRPLSRLSRIGIRSSHTDKGQIIFSVRCLENSETTRLKSLGFRFIAIDYIAPTLSRTLHTSESETKNEFANYLRNMCDYATSNRCFEDGIHITLFVMRPTVREHFEVLTTKGIGNPLPSVKLEIMNLQDQQIDLLSRMEGLSMNTCVRYLRSMAGRSSNENLDDFRKHLMQEIMFLSKSLNQEIRSTARFSARPLNAPSSNDTLESYQPSQRRPHCILLAFYMMGTLGTRIHSSEFDFTPFRLFRAQQQNNTFAGHDEFILNLDQELDIQPEPSMQSDPDLTAPSRFPKVWSLRKHAAPSMFSCSHESLFQRPITPIQGGITVRNEIRIEIAQLDENNTAQRTLSTSDTFVSAGNQCDVSHVYVDELFKLCCTSDRSKFI